MQLSERDDPVGDLRAAPVREALNPGRLVPVQVPTLTCPPAAVFELFGRTVISGGAELGDSWRFWAAMASFLRDLLARQRFVPAVRADAAGPFRAYWRAVVDDEEHLLRLRQLTASMPPVCRAFDVPNRPVQASELVEEFLRTVADATVRRCLDTEDFTAPLARDSDAELTPALRLLGALVNEDGRIAGPPEEGQRLYDLVREWTERVDPAALGGGLLTCLRLHPPRDSEAGTDDTNDSAERWRLTLHLQSARDPSYVIDAARLLQSKGADETGILKRPFHEAERQLRQDVALAARRFEPLAPCAELDGPIEVCLSTVDAHRLINESAAIEAEGLRVWLPRWWQQPRPRLRLWLDVRPAEPSANSVGVGLDSLVSYDWRAALGDDELTLDELRSLATQHTPLLRVKGNWTELNSSEVTAAVRFLEKTPAGRMTLMQALRTTFAADDERTGLPVAGLRSQGWVRQLLDPAEGAVRLEQVDPPASFHGELRPYQLQGLRWLIFLSRHGMGACLADDMGLGKTIQLIALLLSERAEGKNPGPTLLVVPMSLVGNWSREITRFGSSLDVLVHHGLDRLSGQVFVDEASGHDVVISTYGLAHRDREQLAKVAWHRVVLDEAQNIKNPAAKQASAIRSLPAVHRVALTGTPVENRLAELWSIMEFLNPGYLGTGGEFRRRFTVPIERHRDEDRAFRLRQLIRPFVLRRLKSDPKVQCDLPGKLEMTVYCNLTREQASLYEAVVQDMLGQIGQAGGIRRRGLILASLIKLKQICNHPAQYLGDGSAIAQRSGKCERLAEMLDEILAEGDRALVFTQFRRMGDLLQNHLQERLGRDVLFLHGGTTQPERSRMVDEFQSGNGAAPIFILSLKAGGFGLNLTAANHVFHFDRWWNPAVENQATDRAHRIGQQRQVQVHKFVCIGTLEERIAAMMEQKRDLAERVIGSGEEWLTELSTESLKELFVLSREAVVEE